jgi:hypothetical protein
MRRSDIDIGFLGLSIFVNYSSAQFLYLGQAVFKQQIVLRVFIHSPQKDPCPGAVDGVEDLLDWHLSLRNCVPVLVNADLACVVVDPILDGRIE